MAFEMVIFADNLWSEQNGLFLGKTLSQRRKEYTAEKLDHLLPMVSNLVSESHRWVNLWEKMIGNYSNISHLEREMHL